VETRVTYDPLSRLRNTEKTQGTAWMSVLGRSGESGVHTDYSYTDRYELTSSGKYVLQPDGAVGAAAAGTARDYAFDPMGNRTSDQTGSYTPNELNQYTATPTAATLTYDANGNLTGDGAATYAYDAENRLITMSRDHGASSHYTYDYLGRRIRRTATESQKRGQTMGLGVERMERIGMSRPMKGKLSWDGLANPGLFDCGAARDPHP
jgi:YD repeat-containing protein